MSDASSQQVADQAQEEIAQEQVPNAAPVIIEVGVDQRAAAVIEQRDLIYADLAAE